MAQPLIKFFRVATLPAKGVLGALYFVSSEGVLYVCTGETSFEAYAGIKTAALNGNVLTLTPSVGAAISVDIAALAQAAVDLSEYAKTEAVNTAISNAIVAEVERANGAYDEKGAAAAALEAAKAYADGLPHENTTYTFAEGTVNGEFVVTPKGGTPQQVKVHGLGSAAYTEASAYDEAGAAEDVKTALVNGETEFANFKAVGDELRALDADKVADVTVGGVSVVNTDTHVAVLGTAAGKDEGYFVKSEGYVAYSEAEKTKLAGIEAGAEVNIIETVKVNGVALVPDTDRAVDVIIPDAAVKGVKSGDKVLALDSTDGMLSTTVSMEYKSTSDGGDGYIYLKGINGAELGKINAAEFVKDGMIDSVVMGENNVLTITWNTASGKTEATTIDFSKYIDTFTHYGARNGVKIVEDGDTAYYEGVVDPTSETFLTVGEGGFKLAGVQTAINTAVAALDATVGSQTVAEGKHVAVEVVETDGVLTGLTVVESDIASAKEVEENAKVTATALNDLNDRIEAVADSIPTELGVMSVAKGTDGDFVTTTVDNTDAANPKVSVAVSYTESTAAATALATDAYVQEQITASALTWQLF